MLTQNICWHQDLEEKGNGCVGVLHARSATANGFGSMRGAGLTAVLTACALPMQTLC